jgi:23S rRNA pseudouridine1911/1915/1917 synthase
LSARWSEHTVGEDEAGRTVQEILTGPMGISRRMIQRLTRAKALRHNRRPAWLAAKVRAGDVVAARVEAGERGALLAPVAMELAVLYEDAEVLVADKPPFLLVHPTSPAHDRTLAHGVAAHLAARGEPPTVHPLHRIDRDTSGAVLFAKTSHAHHRLDLQLREGAVGREYLALVEGEVEGDAGTVDAPIGRHPKDAQLRSVRPGGDPAVTRWRVEERLTGATLLRCVLETGRTHQIRVHLAHLGHPIVGDRRYGAAPTRLLRRQALHAARLSFTHPTTAEPVSVDSPLPPDLLAAVEALRAG